jgi:hypothetical protein
MKRAFVALGAVLFCAAVRAQAPADNARPRLETRHGVRQLIVDGKPFLILGGELHNSSSSSLAYMKSLWPILVEKKLNTVLAAVSWELLEPEEGKFDFGLVDGIIEQARQNHMHLVLLWFGSWKNGVSSYPPYWVKTDPKRFPLARDRSGKTLNILSTFSTATRDADAKAFATLMRHVRDADAKDHTVLMVQVENEVGVLGDSRDNSPAANAAFARQVPNELMRFLEQHKDNLAPELLNVWKANGMKTSGTWSEVFGAGKPDAPTPNAGGRGTPAGTWPWASDNIFMAWQYAQYVNQITATGKAQYDIPMYANAWLPGGANSRPGDYPSGGPLPPVADIWRAAAPSIDFQSPDLYASQFDEISINFMRNGNALFIPETGAGARGATNALTALLKFNAIGFSPFGIEGVAPRGAEVPVAPAPDPLAQTYAILDSIAPDILNAQGKNSIAMLTVTDPSSPPQTLKLGDYTLTVTYGAPAAGRGARGARGGAGTTSQPTPPASSTAPSASQSTAAASPAPSTGSPARFVICTAPGEYLFVGGPMTVTFAPDNPAAGTTQLASFDESIYVDGRWVPGRRLNGDETAHNSRWPAMPSFGIYRYRVYQRD